MDPDEPLQIDPTPALEEALRRVCDNDHIDAHAGFICNEAERVVVRTSQAQPQLSVTKDLLQAVNRTMRSLERSKLSASKIQAKLALLPDPIANFLELNLMRQLERTVQLDGEDWSDPVLRKALIDALEKTRVWFREKPGPDRREPIQDFAVSVGIYYEVLTGKSPGLGSDEYNEDYKTPFEELWLASARLINPTMTFDQARNIYRTAARPRKRVLVKKPKKIGKIT